MGKGVQYSGDPVILGIRRSLLHVTHRPAPLSVIFPACTPLPTTLRAHSPSSTVNIQCVALKMMRTAPWKSGCTASACVSALTARDSSCVTTALLGTKYSYPLTAESGRDRALFSQNSSNAMTQYSITQYSILQSYVERLREVIFMSLASLPPTADVGRLF